LIEISIRRYSDGKEIIRITVDYDGVTNAEMVAAYTEFTGRQLGQMDQNK
jgi:hypothetical protein